MLLMTLTRIENSHNFVLTQRWHVADDMFMAKQPNRPFEGDTQVRVLAGNAERLYQLSTIDHRSMTAEMGWMIEQEWKHRGLDKPRQRLARATRRQRKDET